MQTKPHPWRRRAAVATAGMLLAIGVAGCSGGGGTAPANAPGSETTSTRYQGSAPPTGKARAQMEREDMEAAMKARQQYGGQSNATGGQ